MQAPPHAREPVLRRRSERTAVPDDAARATEHGLSNLRNRGVPALKAAEIDRSGPAYDMRHTAATIALNDGVPLAGASRRLGHKDTRTTLIVYLGTTDEDQRRAAEKLGELFGGGCCRFRWKETV